MVNNEDNLVKRIAKLIDENKELSLSVKQLTDKVDELNNQNEDLLNKIEILKQNNSAIHDSSSKNKTLRFRMATVLFADIQGFSRVYDTENSHDIIDELDIIYFEFDQICNKYNLQKIKTIGDTYMSAGGVPVKNITNPIDVVLAALEMRDKLNKIQQQNHYQKDIWEIRIGMHTGPVTASTMGKKKVSYSLKGETVNIASRMQSSCERNQINISIMTYEMIREYFVCDYYGKMPVKYQGEVEMYFVKGLSPEYSENGEGVKPNKLFKIKYLLRQFSDLQEIVLDMLEKKLPKYLYYHNFKHTIDVVSQAELIGIGEGVNDEELLLLKTAALFHDCGHIVNYENHEYEGTLIAREMLPKYKYSDEQIDTICEIIMATKLPPQPKNKLERIICDSDLDYLGRSDFIPVSNTLFEELNAQHKIKDINEWNKLQVKFISSHQYFTKTANNLREVNKQKQIERIKKLIK